ncbi:MAG: PQQ-binding-like beta-propeller repeat protein [Christensenellaceae bacterium]
MTETGYIVLIVALAVLAFLAGFGGSLLMRRRGKKVTQEDIPAVYTPENTAGAQANTPYATENTKPEKMGFQTKMMFDGSEVDTFSRAQPVLFDPKEQYTKWDGIVTFRGTPFRDSASCGSPRISKKAFGQGFWQIETGSLEKSDISKGKGSRRWSGSGWTGQPLIVRWDDETKAIMNIYPEKKAKPGLTEAIYATMDGNVYFIDIEDGQKTRDDLVVGLPFKGAGALHPSVPMLFLGPGDSLPDSAGEAGYARAFIYSLIDGKKLYEFGAKDPFAPRIFHGYDSSPLVHEKTDTLIWPGENNIVYTMKLNTNYNRKAGTLSINPSEMLKWTYTTGRMSEDSYWWGMEDSAAFYENYMYIADNGGNMMCVDVNTMQLVWTQDTKDDTNASPVFEVTENGEKHVYVAPSLHWEMNRQTGTGIISIFKMNAITGEIVWEKPYMVHSVNGVSGGVQATPVLGKGEIADLLIVPVARTPFKRQGLLVALDKNTGEERWVLKMPNYAWSSPAAVYADDGKAYIVQCNSKGYMFLIEAATGKVLDKINLGSNIEASPAVFGSTVVIGTRGRKIVGVRIE